MFLNNVSTITKPKSENLKATADCLAVLSRFSC